MQQIRRKKEVEGLAVPGIIQNGGQHFYINVDVYEDGMCNCWELVDLAGLKSKLSSGWLTPAVPDGDSLSIHGLGSFQISSGSWNFDRKGYYDFIEGKIRELNPGFENIYRITDAQKKRMEARRISHSPTAEHFYPVSELFYQTVSGSSFFMFMKLEGCNHLVNLVVYANGTVGIYGADFELNRSINEVLEWFEHRILLTNLEYPSEVVLAELGRVTVIGEHYAESSEEKQKELLDIYSVLKGDKTASETCREAYFQYLVEPSEYNRQRLRETYELVPEHQRMYLGDMDSRDSDYRRIIYCPDDKREV
ncbi:DUF7638 domain-containing protein [Paenibacillus sp. CAU 1782]